MKEALPEPLPADPLPLAETWLAEAAKAVKTATAMTLATVDPEGNPTARMVICRGFDLKAGWLVFYTDRESAKGRALAARPRAAAVFHWDVFERQIRVEGPVTLAPDADSDRYWNTRPVEAQVAASASAQSQPIPSRAAFLARIEAVTRGAADGVSRPPRWGGYRIWAERVELWVGQPGRAHDRAVWTRALAPTIDGFSGGAWTGTRLMP
ncbi:MAG TPA: pyridoxamine 5'-phosphate oxidase [Pseudomonadales bacterium]|nr:pyridoxamine 5'-phosphate oxidase [Pseudomonadales bacterium]